MAQPFFNSVQLTPRRTDFCFDSRQSFCHQTLIAQLFLDALKPDGSSARPGQCSDRLYRHGKGQTDADLVFYHSWFFTSPVTHPT